MTLYLAGNVSENDGNYSFVLADQFADSGISLEAPGADMARRLASYGKAHSVSKTVVVIGDDGRAEFASVKPGLYLLVQEEAADGYYAANPFMVSVPVLENGSYVYDVNASPKIELLKRKPEQPDTETDPVPPDSETETDPVPPDSETDPVPPDSETDPVPPDSETDSVPPGSETKTPPVDPPDKNGPKTGDDSHPELWFAVMILAASAFAGALAVRKKDGKSGKNKETD